jgi:RHS repeat-associated protein
MFRKIQTLFLLFTLIFSTILPINVFAKGDTQAPSTPINLEVVSVTENTATISWTASTDNVGVTSYDVYVGPTGSISAARLTATKIPYTITGVLKPNTSYTITIQAKDAAGNISRTSKDLIVSTLADTEPPTAPSNLNSGVGDDWVTLTWTGSTDNLGVVAYDIYNGTVLEKTVPVTADTVYTTDIYDLTPLTSYSFTIKARDAAGNVSASSTALNVTTLDFIGANNLLFDLTVSWDPSYNSYEFVTDVTDEGYTYHMPPPSGVEGIVGYDFYIQRWDDPKGVAKYVGSSTGTEFIIKGLYKYVDYAVFAYAKDAAGNVIGWRSLNAGMGRPSSPKEYEDPPEMPADQYWADPVDTGKGAHIIKVDALKAKGAQDLTFSLSYDSSRLSTGTMGMGWSNNYEIKLAKQNDGSLFVYWGPGVYSRFTNNGSGIYTSNTLGKQNDVLTQIADGSYLLNSNNDVKYSFDSNGQLTNIQNRSGMNTKVERTYSGNLLITDPVSGQKLTVVYNSDKLVQSVSDSSGRMVRFGYKGIGLTTIIDPDGKMTAYLYDSNGRVFKGTDGEGVVYFTDTYDSNGRIISQDDAVNGNGLTLFSYDTTSISGKTIVTITDRNGKTRKNVFNSLHHLISVTDENENTKSYAYDVNGNISGTTDELGRTTTSIYDNRNHLTEQTDTTGLKTNYTYDANGNLLTQTNPDGSTITYTYDDKNRVTSMIDVHGKTTTYSYDINGLLLKKDVGGSIYTYTYENGLLKTATDPKGGVTTFAYDGAGNLKTTTDSNGKVWSNTFDGNGYPLSKTDPLGNKTSFTYNSRGNILTQTDANGNTTTYQYNGNGKVTTVTDSKDGVLTYSYDGEDRIAQIKDAQGKSTYKFYDPAGRILSETDANGKVTSFTYDAVGNVLSKTAPNGGVTTYTYYSNGKLNTETDAAGNVTTYYYDLNWQLSKITNAAGNDTTYSYDSAGDLLSITDSLNNVTLFTYDKFGNNLTKTDPNGKVTTYTYDTNNNRTSMTDALGNISTYTYDSMGRLLTSTDALENTTSYNYDDAGRLISTTDASGKTVSVVHDGNGNVTETTDSLGNSSFYTYDSSNLQRSSTDALGNNTQNTFDSLGRLTQTTDALGNVTTYTYDAEGQIISSTDALGGVSSQTYDGDGNVTSVTNPVGGSTTYTYDSSDRLATETTTSGGTIGYTYNSLDLISELTNARGQIRDYTYDDVGRIKSYTDAEGTTTYTYDNNGNILTVTDAKGTITRKFDDLNRVTKYIDVDGNSIQYTYDAVGNLTSIIYPDGKTVTYTYDAANRMKTVTDWAGRETSYDYDAAGRLIKTTSPDGSVLIKSYDAANRVIGMNDVDANGNIINNYEFTYDADGHILTESSSNNQTTTILTYDVNGRLISRQDQDADGNVTANYNYTLDSAGNITSSGSMAMTYDTQNRLTTYNNQDITYDADGNMTGGILNGAAANFTYDSKNRLTWAGNTYYAYDADNNRISSTVNGQTFRYVSDTQGSLSRLLSLTDSSGNSTYYVYGIGLIGSQDESGNFSTYHYDYRGSTTAITDINGTVTDRYSYGAYGNLESHTGTSNTPFLYNGRDGVMSDSNGLYYLRSRYYSPELMRFINVDTVKGTIVSSETLNRYAYANGNPISLIDPFGTSAELGNGLHTLLDWAGMAPGIGMFFDSVNAIWYASEGDLTNAAFSTAAVMPGLGDAFQAGRMGYRSSKFLEGFKTFLKDERGFASFGKGKGNLVVDEYGILKKDTSIPGQAHHLNQDAAYRDVIPTNKGMSTKLEGNAFSEVGSPHYNAHESLEQFWNQYRRGGAKYGEVPTNLEYSKAMVDSLKDAGYTQQEAMQIAAKAIEQRVEHGLLGGMPVPRIPSKINQSPRP